jgi:hypothetical protein
VGVKERRLVLPIAPVSVLGISFDRKISDVNCSRREPVRSGKVVISVEGHKGTAYSGKLVSTGNDLLSVARIG